jgi:hypothetical protein
MVLAPEELEIPQNPLSDLAFPPKTIVEQRRACFTLMSRDELLQPGGHTKAFGEFTIGLDALEARRLGIMPTIYYYRPCSDGKPSAEEAAIDGGLSQEILFRMSEARRVVLALAHIEAISARQSGQFKSEDYLRRAGLTLDDEPNVASAIANLEEASSKRILNYFETDRVSACNLVEWLEIILSLFQTADSKNRNTPLEYFAQREWRLIQAYSHGFHCLPLSAEKSLNLPNEESRAYANACREHLTEVIRKAKSKLNAESCYLFVGLPEKHFRDFITEIIVPSDWAVSVRSLVNEMENHSWKAAEISNGFTVFSSQVAHKLNGFRQQLPTFAALELSVRKTRKI